MQALAPTKQANTLSAAHTRCSVGIPGPLGHSSISPEYAYRQMSPWTRPSTAAGCLAGRTCATGVLLACDVGGDELRECPMAFRCSYSRHRGSGNELGEGPIGTSVGRTPSRDARLIHTLEPVRSSPERDDSCGKKLSSNRLILELECSK